MGNEARSAVGFRWMIRALLGLTDPEDGDSLRNMNTAVLPNGATCYVLENSSVYRFRRNVTATPSGEDIVQPLAGDGLWFRVSVDDFLNESAAYVAVTQTNTFATVNDSAWKEPAASFFALQTGFSATQWTLGTLGRLTYNGRGGTFLVTAGWSMNGAADVTDNLYQIGISLNADLNATAQPIAAGTMRFTTEQSDYASITTVRMVTLATGDILQPRARCLSPTAISTLVLEFMSWAVVPIPSV
jgi:hypothetical protein